MSDKTAAAIAKREKRTREALNAKSKDAAAKVQGEKSGAVQAKETAK